MAKRNEKYGGCFANGKCRVRNSEMSGGESLQVEWKSYFVDKLNGGVGGFICKC